MDAALGWLGHLVEWFGRFVPRLEVVPTTHAGIKFVYGKRAIACPAGLHVYWPLVTRWDCYATARQTANLPAQDITTADGRSIAVSGVITYEIVDVLAIYAHAWDPENTVKDIAVSAFGEVLARLSWPQMQAKQRAGILRHRLRKACQAELADYGVRVIACSTPSLVSARVYRVLQSQSQDGI
jgi:regulator of protease activity HflC (stomatin/prohibitin superfamily)